MIDQMIDKLQKEIESAINLEINLKFKIFCYFRKLFITKKSEKGRGGDGPTLTNSWLLLQVVVTLVKTWTLHLSLITVTFQTYLIRMHSKIQII